MPSSFLFSHPSALHSGNYLIVTILYSMFCKLTHGLEKTESCVQYRSLFKQKPIGVELFIYLCQYITKRSSVYLRLQPKRRSSHQGKRHINTVPVRLIRAQNAFHKSHPDQRLCQATIRAMDELASLLGPSEVCYISQDHKARYLQFQIFSGLLLELFFYCNCRFILYCG